MQRDTIERLFYGEPEHQRRFTQDFPILPDVWIEYGKNPAGRVELLLTPHNESDSATLARALRQRLADEPPAAEPSPARVLYNESVVLAALTFPQLLRAALPLSAWWQRAVTPARPTWTRAALQQFAADLATFKPGLARAQSRPAPAAEAHSHCRGDRAGTDRPGAPADVGVNPSPTPDEIQAFAAVFDGLPAVAEGSGLMWSVSLNRRAERERLALAADGESGCRGAAVRCADHRASAGPSSIPGSTRLTRRSSAAVTRGEIASRRPTTARRSTAACCKTYDFLRVKDAARSGRRDRRSTGPPPPRCPPTQLREQREQLRNSLLRGRADRLGSARAVPARAAHPRRTTGRRAHDAHGTHVAGILAANWPEAADEHAARRAAASASAPTSSSTTCGCCPTIRTTRADEFTIIAALQFVRHLNAHKDLMVVHGVNLSLSVPHDVANYACGRTPVCEECERVVAAGVVVVAAAGNRGFNKSADAEGGALGDYRYISITDPGNADGVITVGSTHRMMPHNYGVSYFSSRGPTGDGRTKPDLVAPGERIESCSLNGYVETMDGTSMAAPHVSGAAALLMSRHRELIGQPRAHQGDPVPAPPPISAASRGSRGRGMVDVLRAIQSV